MSKLNLMHAMPGKNHAYCATVRKCLEYVNENNPTREQLTKWFGLEFLQSNNKPRTNTTINQYIKTVENLQLLKSNDGKLLLTALGKSVVSTCDNDILFQQLNLVYSYISSILQNLQQPKSLEQLKDTIGQLDKNWGPKTKSHQLNIRINWLESLGLVLQKDSSINLTEKGRKLLNANSASIADSTVEELKNVRELTEHEKIINQIVELGTICEAITKNPYSMNGNSMDVVWKHVDEKSAGPVVAFEVQDQGVLKSAFSNLQHAATYGVEKLILVTTTPKDKLRAEKSLRTTYHIIKHKTTIISSEQLTDALHKIKEASNATRKMNLNVLKLRKIRTRETILNRLDEVLRAYDLIKY